VDESQVLVDRRRRKPPLLHEGGAERIDVTARDGVERCITVLMEHQPRESQTA
jgi:hypothetical protein